MAVSSDLRMYLRFAAGLRGFLRHPITLEEARSTAQRLLAERESSFLQVVERGIFGYARSPYLPLMKLARIELGDVRAMVQRQGLEPTLHALREAGVYVTLEEFKGREPIVRHGQTIPVRARDFDNPWLAHYCRAQTGGTTGTPTRVVIDLEDKAATTHFHALGFAANGVFAAPTITWRGELPDPAGIGNILSGARFGNVTRRWFVPTMGKGGPQLKYRAMTRAIVLLARLYGSPFPWPRPVSLEQAGVVAGAVSGMLREHGACLLRAPVSMALRVSLAAREAGLDLTGATFMGGGEPPTPAKVREIAASGVRWVPTYFLSESGAVGYGCAHPGDGNDVHFARDSFALIQHKRQVPGTDLTVDAFHFTSLLPTARKVLLNVESDDYGTVETRPCGCLLEECGYIEHLRHIRSYRKLTGEGVTLVGSEMVRVLDEVLPARFGGSPLDYQLLEEEDGQGFTRISLVISPRVAIPNEGEVVEVVLAALRSSGGAASLAQAVWAQAGSLRIKREEPVWTSRGKLTPLRVVRSSVRSGGAAGARPEG